MDCVRRDRYQLVPRLLGGVAGGVWDGTEGRRRVATKLNVMCRLWCLGRRAVPLQPVESKRATNMGNGCVRVELGHPVPGL